MANDVDISRALTINKLHDRLLRCVKLNQPVFLWSGPGIGKSSLVNQIASELSGLCIDLRLSQMQPTDIMGIPYYSPDSNNGLGTMRWAPDARMPTEELAAKYPIIILLLDEMNSASPATQAAAYELVQDRRAGAYKLPDNVRIIAAGNRETDRGVTYRMPAPLANRFVHFEVKPDYDSWLDWALTENINPDIISFLSANKTRLYDFDSSTTEKAFPTPRSYEFASKLITVEKDEPKLSDAEIRSYMESSVGPGVAVEFMAHIKIGKTLPKPIDILTGKITKLENTEVSAQYQIVTNLVYELRSYMLLHTDASGEIITNHNGSKIEKRYWQEDQFKNDWLKMFGFFMDFILSGQIGIEIGIMGLSTMALKKFGFLHYADFTKLSQWSNMERQWGSIIAAS
jgi:hypothetical protein